MRWLKKEIAAPLVRESGVMTLLIPHNCEGFISMADGSIDVKNILVPIDKSPSPQLAVDTACRAAARLNLSNVHFTAIFVGEQSDSPAIEIPTVDGWSWEKRCIQGEVVDSIVQTANDTQSDLIVMTTVGRNGFLDAVPSVQDGTADGDHDLPAAKAQGGVK